MLNRILVAFATTSCLLGCGGPAEESASTGDTAAEASGSDAADVPRGLRLSTPDAGAGYVCFAPLLSDTTYLINTDGRVVHT